MAVYSYCITWAHERELVRLKTGNYIYFIAQANLHFGELIISIIVVSKIDENCCKQTLASLP